jgi:hypothetical protein
MQADISFTNEAQRQHVEVHRPHSVPREITIQTSPFVQQQPSMYPTSVPPPQLNATNDSAMLGLDLLINKKKSDAGSIISSAQSGSGSEEGSSYGSRSEEGSSYVSGSGSGSGDDDSVSVRDGEQYQPRRAIMTEEQVMEKKRELLYQFERMEKRGIRMPKKYNMSSSLDEMHAEIERIKRERQVDASIRFQRKLMMTAVSGLELLTSKFNVVDVNLDGWSQSIEDDIGDYDEVFEELHEKYRGSAKMPPEIRLLFMLGSSAVTFHLANKLSKAAPGLGDVLKANPDLARQFAGATMNTMAQQDQGGMMGGMAGMFSNFFGGGGGGGGRPMPSNANPPPTASRPQQQMKGPSDIDNILRDLDAQDRLETMSTLTESEISEIPDDASINGMLIGKKKGGRSAGAARRTMNL